MQWIPTRSSTSPASSAPANAATCGTISAGATVAPATMRAIEVGHHQRRQVVDADVAERGPEQGDGGQHRAAAQLAQVEAQREPERGAAAVGGAVGVGGRRGYRWVGDGRGDGEFPPILSDVTWSRPDP